MKKGLFISFMAALSIFMVGCENGGKTEGEKFLRHKFDAVDFVINVGEDFDEYRAANADYIIESKSGESKFVMGGYIETDVDKYNINITVSKNRYGTVESIVATPEEKKRSEALMKYFLNNHTAENLGMWQGANWRLLSGGSITAGVLQTVEETIAKLGSGLTGLTMDAIFSIVSGRAYAVATMENESFKFSLVNSFYRLDYDILVGLLGSNWSKLQSDNRFTSYKLGFGTLNYVWFYYALDLHDNVFNMSAYADEQKLEIKTIRLTMPEDVTDDHVAAWKQYAMGDQTLALGTFQKAYLADSTGAEVEPLASQAAAVAYVESNGRPEAFENNVVVEYKRDNVNIVVTIDSMYVTVDLFK